jgi:DNA mismatch endonuclease (patch repair protein)
MRTKGYHLSEETKKKISLSLTGRHPSEETLLKLLAVHHKPKSDKARKNIAAGKMGNKNPNFGRQLSEETKQKLSRAQLGQLNHFYGKHHSEETKDLIRRKRVDQVFPRVTSIEKTLQDVLARQGLIFSTHKNIAGQPDIFIEPNICVFCDGDYWHAHPVKYKPDDYIIRGQTAREIWAKDHNVTRVLESQGYTVLRFWERDINRDLNSCIWAIRHEIQNSKG